MPQIIPIVSFETLKKQQFMNDIYQKIDEAERNIADGKTHDAHDVAAELKTKYGL